MQAVKELRKISYHLLPLYNNSTCLRFLGRVLLLVYSGMVRAITECSHGRTGVRPSGDPRRGSPTAKQSTGLFLLPILRFALLGDFALCGARRGLLALDLARAPPLDPAALKGWRTFYVFAFEGLELKTAPVNFSAGAALLFIRFRFNLDIQRCVYLLSNVLTVLFALFNAFGEEIFNLSVDGAEIILSPSGKGVIELFRYS